MESGAGRGRGCFSPAFPFRAASRDLTLGWIVTRLFEPGLRRVLVHELANPLAIRQIGVPHVVKTHHFTSGSFLFIR